jgi:hypothetical protein
MSERRPWDENDSAKLTAADRKEPHSVLRRREKEADESAEEVKARRLPDFEEELATIFSAEDAAFADVTAFAQEMIEKADAEIDRRCDELGIRRAFRPELRLGWSGRGENTSKERRNELRKVAEARAEADKLSAKKQIRRTFTDQQELIALGALSTEEARAFLAQMPRPETLMPEVRLAEHNVADKKTERQLGYGSVPLLAIGPPGEDDRATPRTTTTSLGGASDDGALEAGGRDGPRTDRRAPGDRQVSGDGGPPDRRQRRRRRSGRGADRRARADP